MSGDGFHGTGERRPGLLATPVASFQDRRPDLDEEPAGGTMRLPASAFRLTSFPFGRMLTYGFLAKAGPFFAF